ncbi:hypothetical protein HK104_000262 [Borealophlyctis nickersoniae]|nr:hypothetical protein HK104_000262 [Borealophlyctis nickersoniae]
MTTRMLTGVCDDRVPDSDVFEHSLKVDGKKGKKVDLKIFSLSDPDSLTLLSVEMDHALLEEPRRGMQDLLSPALDLSAVRNMIGSTPLHPSAQRLLDTISSREQNRADVMTDMAAAAGMDGAGLVEMMRGLGLSGLGIGSASGTEGFNSASETREQSGFSESGVPVISNDNTLPSHFIALRSDILRQVDERLEKVTKHVDDRLDRLERHLQTLVEILSEDQQ